MSKHSPGPWMAKLDARFSFGRSNQESSYGEHGGIYDAKGNPVVGCDEYDVFWGPRRADNVRLIAAAPDMLDALKKIEAYLERWADETECGHFYGVAHDAITKAEGTES